MITVASFSSLFIRFKMACSVMTSILEVASSNITILAFLRIARQMQINYFSPDERLFPDSSILNSNILSDPALFAIIFSILAFLSTSRIS